MSRLYLKNKGVDMELPSASVLIQVTLVGLLTGGVYALMAAGLTLVFGVMRVINIAHGAFLIFSAYISYWLFTTYGLDPFLSVIVSVPLLFIIGLVFQHFMLSRLRNEPGLVVLVTFSLALALEGLMGTVFETTGRSIRTWYTTEVVQLPIASVTLRLPVVRIAGFVAAVIALYLLYLLLTRSDLGRAIRATIQNKDAAQLVGVNIAWVQALTFGLGLGSVAAGGAIFSLIWTFNAASHEEWISKMLSVIVLGGMGSLPGAFVAALIMGVAESVAAVTMTSYLSPIVFYLILFLTLIFRPQGLMGTVIRRG
jgi:branched-chain amino acid transport system permease protein